MNYIALLVGAYLAFHANHYQAFSFNKSEWIEYKLKYGKQYENYGVEALRRTIYLHNKQRVEHFNSARPEAEFFKLELNHLADMSDLEMMHLNGFRPRKSEDQLGPRLKLSHNSQKEQKFLDDVLNGPGKVPDAMDWRQVPGRVSRVRDQDGCGSCWAFSAVGALEGQEKLRPAYSGRRNSSDMVELSEQNLVDCVQEDEGCNGGLMEDAFRYVNSEGGINERISYPYQAQTLECRFKKDRVAFMDTGAARLTGCDEQRLKELVAKFGPVSVSIDASSSTFFLYRKGVYVDEKCKSNEGNLNHGVLVVGYGTDPKGGDYWIVKNSWGPHWGENGYIRMSRNRSNMCGIGTAPVIPTF